MDYLLDKISSYNILNYLIPGVTFEYIIQLYWGLTLFEDEDVIIRLILGYVLGMMVSRAGSLIIERICKKSKFVIFADYDDYLNAEKQNPKIRILTEQCNMYRTFAAMFILAILGKVLMTCFGITFDVIFAVLAVVFILSYRKQVDYVRKAVENTLTGNSDHNRGI